MSSAANRSSGIGVADQFEMDQMAGDELTRLQRQVRAMENERIFFTEDKCKKQRKNKKIIEILMKEKLKIQEKLDSIQEGPHAKKERKMDIKVTRLFSELESAQQLLDDEKYNLSELEGHIRKLEKEINRLRNNEVTDIRYKDTIFKTQKDVIKLENRLDVTNKKAGVVLAENSELRQQIDHMLQERSSFNEMWQKMVNQLNQGKKYILDLIEQSTSAYDQREELCNKLQALKDRGQADKMLHIQEMRELQRKLDHDAKLQQFLETKGQHRSNTELEAREAEKKKQAFEDVENQKKEFAETLEKIRVFSSEYEVDKLAVQFVKQEEENFALFNYVNELSHEVEILIECVQLLEDNIEEQKLLNAAREKTQMETMASLQKDLDVQKEMTKKALQLNQEAEQKLKELENGVEKIFRLIRCEDAPVLNLLGSQKQVSIHNVNLFIGIIERRANNIISTISTTDQPSRVLGKKDRIPKFNVRESAKQRKPQF